MPPKKGKKGKKKKKKAPKIDPNALTEVDKTFYELTITDLNRKLARLRSLTTDLEERNEQLQNDLTKLDEDRNDIIIYLKRILQERADEIAELQERLKGLEETRQEETETYEAKITDLENEYKQMHEQLTSEIKLLEGKLNSLEEFRIQRDELMKKFEDQETAMEEQEKRHKNELYEIERKFIIGKDKLKKDMEARLLQLSSEFQEATELRIAATTHRVIRENIAINNELDAMLITHDRLYSENSDMKDRDRILRQEAELHEAEKRKVLAKVRTQTKIIERLTNEHEEMMQKLTKYQTIEKEMHEAAVELQRTKQNVLCLNHQIRVLEQNVHALKCKETSIQTEMNNVQGDNDRLSVVLAQAVFTIKETLEVQSKMSDEALKISKRESLLNQLFSLLSEAEKQKARRPSLDTIGSLTATYERGDLGFVPKPSPSVRSSIPTIRHIEAQTGPSFDEFLAIGKEEDLIQKASTSFISLEEESGGSEGTYVEEESDVYFDEEEDTVEDSFEYDDLESYEEDDENREHRKSRATSVKKKESVISGEMSKEQIKRQSRAGRSQSTVSVKKEDVKTSKSSISKQSDASLKKRAGKSSVARVRLTEEGTSGTAELEKIDRTSVEKVPTESVRADVDDGASKIESTKEGSRTSVKEKIRASKESLKETEVFSSQEIKSSSGGEIKESIKEEGLISTEAGSTGDVKQELQASIKEDVKSGETGSVMETKKGVRKKSKKPESGKERRTSAGGASKLSGSIKGGRTSTVRASVGSSKDKEDDSVPTESQATTAQTSPLPEDTNGNVESPDPTHSPEAADPQN